MDLEKTEREAIDVEIFGGIKEFAVLKLVGYEWEGRKNFLKYEGYLGLFCDEWT
jgi:hypothetical protein